MAELTRPWRFRSGEIVLDRTRVMGVLNVTPDSFSDGGRHYATDDAIRRGLQIVEEGASVLDIGGESARPRAEPVSAEEEWRRVGPVLRGLEKKLDLPISIDTRKADVAAKALEHGAAIVNDIAGLTDPQMVRVVSKHNAGAVIMHMRGSPKTMQDEPRYADVVREVRDFLSERAKAAIGSGIPADAIAVDPGIGFGKTVDQNLALLRSLRQFRSLGHPVVVGVSRKSFMATLGAGERPEDRLPGSVAAAVLAVAHGAHLIRAHDVLETVRAMRVVDAVLHGRENL